MSTDILYKLGHGSRYNDDELRYSLRSLSNFTDLGKVYIVGYLPSWVKNVIHIPADDPYLNNKDANIINKIILGCINKDISDYFLQMSDDQVITKECDFSFFKIPIIDNNILEGKIYGWKRRVLKTVQYLKEKKLPNNVYEAHCPYLINKHKYPEILLNTNYGDVGGLCGNTIYFNSIKSDYKDNSEVCSVRNLNDIDLSKTILNYNSDNINPEFLKELFPLKSEFEV